MDTAGNAYLTGATGSDANTFPVKVGPSVVYHGGDGPSHSALTASFVHAGYSDADPYDSALGTPNKEQRVLAVTRASGTSEEQQGFEDTPDRI